MIQTLMAASAARAVSGNGAVVDTAAGLKTRSGKCRFTVDVTAASGTTPTLDISIRAELTDLPGKPLRTIGSLPQITAVGQYSVVLECTTEKMRMDWVIAGTTPSFTFSIEAVQEF
jgi:hypothetical protein